MSKSEGNQKESRKLEMQFNFVHDPKITLHKIKNTLPKVFNTNFHITYGLHMTSDMKYGWYSQKRANKYGYNIYTTIGHNPGEKVKVTHYTDHPDNRVSEQDVEFVGVIDLRTDEGNPELKLLAKLKKKYPNN